MSIQSVIPFLRYRDARAAIGWLERTLGATPKMVVDGPDGAVAHAEIVVSGGVVMLGSARAGGGRAVQAGGADRHGIYVVIDDADGLFARAQEAGATVEMALHDTEYGSREFALRDPEGFLWSLGTYRP